MTIRFFIAIISSLVITSCADSGFNSGGAPLGKKNSPRSSNQNVQQNPPFNNRVPPQQNIQFGSGSDNAPADPITPPCFTPNANELKTNLRVKGENWPNNTVDPGGADFDDYFVDISGEFELQNGWEIFSTKEQTITINYSLGTPGYTSQNVKIHVIDCEGNDQGSFSVSQGSGSRDLEVKIGQRFNLFTTAVTSGQTREFDLIQDQAAAYRIEEN